MSSVGSHLRELRERRGVSLEEISRSTRVLSPRLQALEADNFAALPAPAFVRGFIRAYCQALGEHPDAALALYEASRPPGRPEGVGPRVAQGSDAALGESRTRAEQGTPQEGVTDVAARYRLVARTSELTWIRVRMDDGRMSEENIPAGEVREWVSNRPFVLSIGNAGGVTLELNGQRLPPLGRSGAAIARLVLPSEGQ